MEGHIVVSRARFSDRNMVIRGCESHYPDGLLEHGSAA